MAISFIPDGTAGLAVIAPDDRYMVSVYVGPDTLTAVEWEGGKKYVKGAARLSGHDITTRLCFFTNPSPVGTTAGSWAKAFGNGKPQALVAVAANGSLPCHFEKWVTQVGDKVLPLGLLSVAFQTEVPIAGTPLVDAKGEIVGLILQPSSGLSAYAIPCQAVHRVQHDIHAHQKLVRGWMGISLSTESMLPRITRVWPDSPASKAKLRENDILIRAGSYGTEKYSDAVNALFYAVPGEPVRIEIQRGDERLSTTLTPTVQKPGK